MFFAAMIGSIFKTRRGDMAPLYRTCVLMSRGKRCCDADMERRRETLYAIEVAADSATKDQ